MGLVLIGTWTDDPATFADSWGWSLDMLWVFGLGALVRRQMLLTVRARDAADARAAASAAEERLAVARDLHDVLAHSLAVMIVQAEAADELVDTDPLRAHRALARVEETGRSALGDIRGLVEALRNDGDQTASPSSTTPGLDALPALLESVRASGLPVELRLNGNIDRVSSESGQVIYRVVQEALTNTLRHAGAAATVVAIDVDAGIDVRVQVHDEGAAPPVTIGAASPAPRTSSVGHGLRGMRERVTYAGGTLEAGPDIDGGFSVIAVLPRGRTST